MANQLRVTLEIGPKGKSGASRLRSQASIGKTYRAEIWNVN